MNTLVVRSYTFSIGAVAALLAGCGGSQTVIGPPGSEYQTTAKPQPHSFKVLYRFAGGRDGAYPIAGLTDINGTLYGTTDEGGSNECASVGWGTVYSISTKGVEKVVHRFGIGADGAFPAGRLEEFGGTLYGTTAGGGEFGFGAVYRTTTSGREKVLHGFEAGYADGSEPETNLVAVNGTLYGTTYIGGSTSSSQCSYDGCGTVYSVGTGGAEKILHRFGQASDGQLPEAGLVNVRGVMYGTTDLGGGSPPEGKGIVFSIPTTGAENVLYRFQGPPDAEEPQANLIDWGGKLYGTTSAGGTATQCTDGCATVPRISQ